MKVYFSANHRNIQNDMRRFRVILDAIRSTGFSIINGWIEAVGHRQPPYENPVVWTNICVDARSGLDGADIVICEASGPSSFGPGLEVGYAIARKKKVILLIRKDSLNDSYASGLDPQEVHRMIYTDDMLFDITKAALLRMSEKR